MKEKKIKNEEQKEKGERKISQPIAARAIRLRGETFARLQMVAVPFERPDDTVSRLID